MPLVITVRGGNAKKAKAGRAPQHGQQGPGERWKGLTTIHDDDGSRPRFLIPLKFPEGELPPPLAMVDPQLSQYYIGKERDRQYESFSNTKVGAAEGSCAHGADEHCEVVTCMGLEHGFHAACMTKRTYTKGRATCFDHDKDAKKLTGKYHVQQLTETAEAVQRLLLLEMHGGVEGLFAAAGLQAFPNCPRRHEGEDCIFVPCVGWARHPALVALGYVAGREPHLWCLAEARFGVKGAANRYESLMERVMCPSCDAAIRKVNKELADPQIQQRLQELEAGGLSGLKSSSGQRGVRAKLTELHGSMRARARDFFKDKKDEDPEAVETQIVDLDWLFNKAEEQGGVVDRNKGRKKKTVLEQPPYCAYCFHVMGTDVWAKRRISPDRQHDKETYVQDNIELACLEHQVRQGLSVLHFGKLASDSINKLALLRSKWGTAEGEKMEVQDAAAEEDGEGKMEE